MFAESAGAAAAARPFIDRALAGAARATPREQRFIHAVAAWVDGDVLRAIALHDEQAREHPRDLASLKLGHYHLFNRGDAPGMLRMALAALPAAGRRALPARHAGLRLGAVPRAGAGRSRGPARDGAAAQGAVGAPCAGARDAHAGPAARRPRLPGRGQPDLDRPQLVHGHAQLVAPGAVRARTGPARRGAAPVRRAQSGAWPRSTRRTRSTRCRCSRGWNWPASTSATAGRTSPTIWHAAPATRCCPSWTCSTCWAWRGQVGPKPTRSLRNIEARAAASGPADAAWRDVCVPASRRPAGLGARRARDGRARARSCPAAPAGDRRQPRPARPVRADPPRCPGAQRPPAGRAEPAAAATARPARVAPPAPSGVARSTRHSGSGPSRSSSCDDAGAAARPGRRRRDVARPAARAGRMAAPGDRRAHAPSDHRRDGRGLARAPSGPACAVRRVHGRHAGDGSGTPGAGARSPAWRCWAPAPARRTKPCGRCARRRSRCSSRAGLPK